MKFLFLIGKLNKIVVAQNMKDIFRMILMKNLATKAAL